MSADAPGVPERTNLDRFLAAVPVAIGALAILSLLAWEASIRRSPTIFSDELEWTQISRAIAATGHAARRGEPISFKSLYAFLIAPAWWIHSTGAAYATIKYLNTAVMSLAAVPTYLLARTLVSKRVAVVVAFAAICTSALYYAAFILPEVLAYPTFALCAWVSIRALAGGGRRFVVAAIVLDLLATQVREELAVLPAAFAVAAVLLWVVGPRGQRLRRNWSVFDHITAAVVIVAVLVILNSRLGIHSTEWTEVTRHWMDRFWSLGFQAASALAIGLALLPVVGGLASLWLPERRHDPNWRAFAAFTASAIAAVFTYTAIKAAYLSTVFATRVEERNMIYLGPLLLVGTAVVLTARRPWLPGILAAWAFTAWLVLHYGYQLDDPYFEAPGYGIAAMANRAWRWDQATIRTGLAVTAAIVLAVFLVLLVRRLPERVRAATLLLAASGTFTWMLAGEVTTSRGSANQSKVLAEHMPQPLDWIDRATGGSGTTFLGQSLSLGDDLGVNLLEFWNRSVHNIWSLDGTAPPPGPTLTPDLLRPDGSLSSDPGLRYAVATDRVDLAAPTVATQPGLVLSRLARHPWRLQQATYGVSSDGWIVGTSDDQVARGRYAYFDATHGPGTLEVDVGRRGFCDTSAPGTNVVVRIGPVALDEQRAPHVVRPATVRRFHVANCGLVKTRVHVQPPVAVEVVASPTLRPSDYGASESRELGAQVGFAFTPKR